MIGAYTDFLSNSSLTSNDPNHRRNYYNQRIIHSRSLYYLRTGSIYPLVVHSTSASCTLLTPIGYAFYTANEAFEQVERVTIRL